MPVVSYFIFRGTGLLETLNIGWTADSFDVGRSFVHKLAQCLWYLDPHHQKFLNRGTKLPVRFNAFQGYNDYKRKKEKEPRLCARELLHHADLLSGMLMQPWFSHPRFRSIRDDVAELADVMHQYALFLAVQNEKVKAHHTVTSTQYPEDSATLVTLPAKDGPISKCYKSLCERLHRLEVYQPVFLNEIAPAERFARRHWLAELQLPFPVMLYKFAYGNHLGTIVFLWKVPNSGPVDQTEVSCVFSRLTSSQAFYSSRAMRHDFLEKYCRLAKIPKMILHNIYRTLLEDQSSASCRAESEVNERLAQALIEMSDTDITLDLQGMNGSAKSSKFDKFWEELQLYFDESILAVDERRHGDALHMPLAVSLRHLREMITSRLKEKFPEDIPPVPSLEWIRLQFWPANPYTETAVHYTGQFKVKFGVQIRQLRKGHPDSHYVSALLQYARHFAVRFYEYVSYLSVDDKATVPVGEPDCPISTGVRGHNQSLVPLNGPTLLALDHDFHVHGIVPSVAFFVDIPENPKDSFFNGQAFVTNKYKVTEPSSPLRHATETCYLIQTHDNGASSSKPILVIVSDGGPDHRVTYGSVKVSAIALFRALDLDMLICLRTCPYQSWQNIAERIMSTLNFALQNVSLARRPMDPEFEKLLQSKNSLLEVRETIEKNPNLGCALKDSMSPPLIAVSQRFQAMEVKGTKVKVGVPATAEEQHALFEQVTFSDSCIRKDKLSQKDLAKAKDLQDCLESHAHSSQYVFQIKKCSSSDCSYCEEHPVRIPERIFSSISFLPLPRLDTTKEHYKEFDAVYGQTITEEDCPSLSLNFTSEGSKVDKGRKNIIISAKVRGTITCSECYKPRCIYSKAKLSQAESTILLQIKDSRFYTCGSSLFAPGSALADTVVVKEVLTCNSPMESQYHSAVLVKFVPVCYYCGLGGDGSLVEDEDIVEMRKSYAFVSPICFLCRSDGKKPFCKMPCNVAKKRRTN